MENSFFYCERTSLYFFSEPLNIITNFCFIFTSFLLLKDKSIKNKFFPIIIFFIGIGSLLLHSIPSSLTAFLDVFFIVLFIVYYLYNFYNFLNIKKYISISLSILFIYLCHLFGNSFSSSFLGSSSYYFPIVIHLYLIYLYLFINKSIYKKYNYFLLIAFLFSISLLLRTLDKKLCNINFYGTHFIWHIANSIVLYLLVKFLYLPSNRTSPKKPS